MQFTLIAVQKNGQQLVLGQDVQTHSVSNMVREAVASSESTQTPDECRYRSFIAFGTDTTSTTLLKMNSRGDVVHRTVGLT